MKPTIKRHKLFFFALFMLVVSSAWLTGCAHTDPENAAQRPWNSPQGWENGLPSGMMPGY